MGRIHVVGSVGGEVLQLQVCKTHLALASDCSSKAFVYRGGNQGYLFNNAVNVTIGPLEERRMITGVYTAADTFCCYCGQILGWKYEITRDPTQKYKEGKFVLERGMIEETDFFRVWKTLFRLLSYLERKFSFYRF